MATFDRTIALIDYPGCDAQCRVDIHAIRLREQGSDGPKATAHSLDRPGHPLESRCSSCSSSMSC
jgi:hypothetical protein